jgi:hypothetical protein
MNRSERNNKRFTVDSNKRETPVTQRPYPPEPEPKTRNSSQASQNNGPRLGKGAILALAFLVFLASLAILLPRIADNLNKPVAPQPIHIEDTFMDIDSDGDMDFVDQADVLLNCGGQLCSPTPVPALQAPQAGELGGDPLNETDPDVGGGNPDD